MYRAVFVVAALLILAAQAEAHPHTYLHRVQHFRQAMAVLPSDERVVRQPTLGMPERVLWMRGVSVSVWSYYSQVESRRQLAAFSSRSSRSGHGGGELRPRHDSAAARHG